jgi:hypothetical protein
MISSRTRSVRLTWTVGAPAPPRRTRCRHHRWSRLPNTEHGSLDAVRSWCISWVASHPDFAQEPGVRAQAELLHKEREQDAGGVSGHVKMSRPPRVKGKKSKASKG